MFNLIVPEKKFEITSKNEYAEMVKSIEENLPILKEGIAQFGKAQSQFMDNFLTVSHPTPLRNVRQILSEINQCLEALREAQYKIEKQKIEIKRLEDQITGAMPLEIEEAELEIAHKKSNIKATMVYVEGAIRRIANHQSQYDLILKKYGYEKLTEENFEAEEEEYHIKKAFEQAICAARSRGGFIDEGNHIYFQQIGINGGMAERYIKDFFIQEARDIDNGEHLGHEFLTDFLSHMAKVFKGCSDRVAEIKGNKPITKEALLRAV